MSEWARWRAEEKEWGAENELASLLVLALVLLPRRRRRRQRQRQRQRPHPDDIGVIGFLRDRLVQLAISNEFKFMFGFTPLAVLAIDFDNDCMRALCQSASARVYCQSTRITGLEKRNLRS